MYALVENKESLANITVKQIKISVFELLFIIDSSLVTVIFEMPVMREYESRVEYPPFFKGNS